MGMKQGREYRAVQDFSLVPRAEEKDEYRVRGTAVVFDTPTVLFEYDGVKYSEVIDRNAFDECDMSDVIFNYNHGGKVVARLRNKTLTLTIDERGLHMEADLGGTQAGRELYEEIDGGYVDKMSFSQRSRSYTTCRRWIFPRTKTQKFPRAVSLKWSIQRNWRLWSKPRAGNV